MIAPGAPCVIDASALLALAHNEPGSGVAREHLQFSVASAINWSEVVQKSLARGVDVGGLREEFATLGLTIYPFGPAEAEQTAELWLETRSAGLSLADRACLSLARQLGLPVLTADRAWAALSLDVTVQLLR